MVNNITINNISNESLKRILKKGIRLVPLGLVTAISLNVTGCGKEEDKLSAEGIYIFEESNGDHVSFGQDTENKTLAVLRDKGREVTKVSFDNCLYIDDLDNLDEYCPYLEILVIDKCPSIGDLSFIYSCDNLKKVEITENAFITPALVEYFEENGIEHNITESDLEISKEIDSIIDEIIRPEMSDEEKIQAITMYVINNYKYNDNLEEESNLNPLTTMIQKGEGVCAGYAYLTNTLLRKVGITSYEIIYNQLNSGHGWNLIELDGKYYYLDTTNINQIPILSNFALEKFNVGFHYMTDPKATFFSPMKDYDKECVVIPEGLIEDIEKGESEKNLIEKYGNSVTARVIEMLSVVLGVGLGIKMTAFGISSLTNSKKSKRR